MEKKFESLIIGVAILGVAHACHCLNAGLSVVLIERNAARCQRL